MSTHTWSRPTSALTRTLVVLVLLLMLTPLVGHVTPVAAATITVNDTGTVVANDGKCTLIEAITAANTDTASGTLPGECPAGSGADTLVLQAGAIYTLTAVNNSDELGPTGLPNVTTSITVQGNGAIVERSTVAGTPSFRILRIECPGSSCGALNLDRVTIRGAMRQAPMVGAF